MKRLALSLPSAEATEQFAAALADVLQPWPARAIAIELQGPLGAGKSTLARALLRRLGVTGTVRSPTYTLIERYPLAYREVLHLDLYRIADPDELDYLGLDELAERAALWLIEWPDRGGGRVPSPDLQVQLEYQADGRRAELRACSERAERWLERLRGVADGLAGPSTP